ncbi:hypothetical protein BDB01DRAFT_717827 [Pilobolus umbonatus]|nr:hypothetical protein BDB01DRAFT_717827 [Pilobolus umbonatus]
MLSSRLSPFSGLIRNNISVGAVYSNQRLFSFTSYCRDEETTKTPESEESVAETAVEEVEPVKLSRRRRRFHEWANGSGKKYSRPAQGTTNYLGITPFPNNPLFQPRPPLSDITRQEIYNAFTSDPDTWTGIPLQKKFAKGMEQLLGVDQTGESFKEPLIDVDLNVTKPKFKTLEEDASFGPTDAAKVLNRLPFKDLERRIIESEQAEFSLPLQSIAPKESTPRRGKFVIVDTSA